VFAKGCLPDVLVTSAEDAGAGTFRQAMLDVCSSGVITFAGIAKITLNSEIVVGKTVTVDGTGALDEARGLSPNLLQITGDGSNRLFRVDDLGDLTLRRLRLSNGVTGDVGGAIHNSGRLSLRESRFDANQAGSPNLGGGAIFNSVGALLDVEACTFDQNVAARGAAIFTSGTAELRNSTFSENTNPTDTVREGTIQNRGTLVAIHITVANNGQPDASVGGLFAFNADTTLINSIFADNVGNNCTISGGTHDTIGLLSESGNCERQFSADPQFQSLNDNGGITQTMRLDFDSPAIDVGEPEFCLADDQRGVSRLQGDGCDLGAFEVDDLIVFRDSFESDSRAAPNSR
jgi:hypothetical protein